MKQNNLNYSITRLIRQVAASTYLLLPERPKC